MSENGFLDDTSETESLRSLQRHIGKLNSTHISGIDDWAPKSSPITSVLHQLSPEREPWSESGSDRQGEIDSTCVGENTLENLLKLTASDRLVEPTMLSPVAVELLEATAKAADESTLSPDLPTISWLFRLFLRLTSANNLDKDNFREYGECGGVLAEMAEKSHFMTFHETLMQILQRGDEQELERRLTAFYYHRDIALKSKYLDSWVETYARRSETRDLHITQAVYYDDRRVCLNALHKIQHKCGRLVKAEKALQTQSKRKYLNRWVASRKYVGEMERDADYRLLGRVFLSLQRAATSYSDDYRDAITFNDANILSRHYLTWCDQLTAVQFDNNRLKQQFLRIWLSRTHSCSDMMIRAEDESDVRLLATSCDKWKQEYQKILFLRNKAREAGFGVLKESFDYWREGTHLKATCTQFLNGRGQVKTIAPYFKNWRQLVVKHRQADKFYTFTLAFKMFRTWQLNTKEQNVRLRFESKSARFYLQRWRDAKNAILFQRKTSENISRSVLSLWHGKTMHAYEVSQLMYDDALGFDAVIIASRLFYRWNDKMRNIVAMDIAADDARRDNLRRKGLSILIKGLKRSQLAKVQADELFVQQRTRPILRRWAEAALTRKLDWMEESYSAYREAQDERLLRMAFRCIRLRYSAVERSVRLADTLNLATIGRVVSEQLVVWRDKARAFEQNKALADEIHHSKLLYKVFSQWLSRNQTINSNREEASFISEVRDLHRQQQYYRHWKLRALKCITLRQQADKLVEQRQQRRSVLSRFLHIWKATTKEVVAQRASSTFTPGLLTFKTPGPKSISAARTVPRNTTYRQGSYGGLPATPPPASRQEPSAIPISPAYEETPSRVLSKTKLPRTAVGRWRDLHGGSTPSVAPVTPFHQSSLNHVVTASATGSPERVER